jgi:hypothetical protein
MTKPQTKALRQAKLLLEEHFYGFVLGLQVAKKDVEPLVVYADTSYFAAAGLANAVSASFTPTDGISAQCIDDEDDEDDEDIYHLTSEDGDDDVDGGPEDPTVKVS